MRSDHVCAVDFHARDEGSSQLTWGQRNMWFPLRDFGSESANYNIKQAVVRAAGIALDEALHCIRRLVEQHQALRMTVRAAETEDPEQIISSSGTYQVHLHGESDDYQNAIESALELAAALPFDLKSGFPARFHCVLTGGRVRAIVIVVSHVAADVGALRILARRLGALMDGRPEAAPDPPWEPLDQARFERSERGLNQERRALAYWTQTLAAVPGPVFGPPRPIDGPAFHRVGIESRALAAAAQRLAGDTQVSTSAVLLAATSLMLGAVSGRDFSVLKIIASNRHTPRLRNLVSNCAQDGLFAVHGLSAESFRGFIGKTLQSSTLGLFNAQYDPRRAKDAVREIEAARGTSMGLSMYFNDSRMTASWDGLPPANPAEIDDLRKTTRVEYLGSHSHDDMSFHLHVRQCSNACRIELSANAGILTPHECGAFLAGMEDALCRALADEVDVTGFHLVPVEVHGG